MGFWQRHIKEPDLWFLRLYPATIVVLVVAVGWLFVKGYLLQSRAYSGDVSRFPGISERLSGVDTPITPIQPIGGLNLPRVRLGHRLFAEKRLSHDNSISCESCHDLGLGGVDRRRFAIGILGQSGTINAPTVFNSALNFRQFWDGRAATLEDQINGPLNNRVEMGSNWPEVLGKLAGDPGYRREFSALYPDGITPTNVRDAIATFERSLTTPNSRFDRYLRGNTQALTTQEAAGYGLFRQYGCISCHQGEGMGGNFYEKLGVVRDYFKDRGHLTRDDLGRYNLTHVDEHRFEFKVPSLRNVALTAPYFHDGSVPTLDRAIALMGQYQLGVEIPKNDIRAIKAFLGTLTGEYQGHPL